MSYGDHSESGKNYQPGLELSNLQRQLSLYLMQKKEREEKELQARQAKVNAAKVGKQGLDYWSLDQRAKEMAYLKDPKQYVPNADFESDNFASRFFTPANKRVSPGPENPALNDKTAWNKQVGISEEGPITRGVDKVKSLSNDIKAKILRSPDAEALLNPPHTGPSANPSAPGSFTTPDDISLANQTNAADMKSIIADTNSGAAAGNAADLLDEAYNPAVAEASKLSKVMDTGGKVMGGATALYSGYNLATNWDDMTENEKWQEGLRMAGGTFAATGVGTGVGIAMGIAASIWDLLD